METTDTSGTPFFDVAATAGEWRCVFFKRMDTVACAQIEKAFLDQLAGIGERKVILDVEKVDYVASAFLRLCAMASKAAGGRLAILHPQPTVRKVLKIAGLEHLAEID
ncbi:MAG: STAS domain-containing protein [Lentisphaeria bacterium]